MLFGSREKEWTYLCGPLTVGELFLPKSRFSPGVNSVGQYPSCLQGSFFHNRTGLSGKSEAILNCNFGHICRHEWGYGKYVMWPPKEHLDNIQYRNKRALVQTDCHKDQTALSHCPYHHVHSGPHWLDVLQSAGIVADNFIGPVLILQATLHSCKHVPGYAYNSLCLLDRFGERNSVTVSYYLSATLHPCFFPVCCCVISQHCAQVLSSPLSSPVWKGSQRALMPPHTHFTHTQIPLHRGLHTCLPYRWPQNERNAQCNRGRLASTVRWI